MAKADRLYISHVDLAPEGDVLFPPIDPELWRVVEEPEVPASERDAASFRVRVYERR
jgi:dihydrofolate reductase